MNNTQSYEAMEVDYGLDTFRRSTPVKSSRRRRPSHDRRGKSPQSVNGIHRRRNRKKAGSCG